MIRTYRSIIAACLTLCSISTYADNFTMNKPQELVALAKEKNIKIATAESCTGGMIGTAITSISGSSAVFDYGYITYANDAKVKLLGVQQSTLQKYGAVSEQTAREMAIGALKASGANIAVSATGIAGPTGGTPNKPVGTVFIATATKNNVIVTENHFVGNREQVRNSTVVKAISMCIDAVKNYD